MWGSTFYKESLNLRDKVLRTPLGLSISDDNLSDECNQIHFGAFLNDSIVGTILFKAIDSSLCKMRQVAVNEDYRGLGIGRLLVWHFENFTLEKGISNIELNSRAYAVPFYEKLGYEVCSDMFIEVTIPHYKMKKTRILKTII